MHPRSALLAAAISGLTLACAVTGQSTTGCFDSNVGTRVPLNDDQLAIGLQLPFAFPLPGGGTTSFIDVSSNGFVYLQSGLNNSSGCCNGDPAAFVAGPARIAMWWNDLQPPFGGTVSFLAQPNMATITFEDVPEFPLQGSNTFQLQLFPNGSFQLSWRELTAQGSHDVLVGVTPGGGTGDPGETDLSAAGTFDSGTEPTIYELFRTGSDARDLENRALMFLPNGNGGYLVMPRLCAQTRDLGTGCPTPASFFEQFATGAANDLSGLSIRLTPNGAGGYDVRPGGSFDPSFANPLGASDDVIFTDLPLGFTIPIPGAGMVSAIDVSSNGWCSPAGTVRMLDVTPTIDEFIDQGTRFALAWDDLSPDASRDVYFDTAPGVAMVTYDRVPQFFNSDSNTFQIQFRQDGSVTMVWQQVGNDCLAGFAVGNGFGARIGIDLTSDLPYSGGTLDPLAFASSAPAAIGTTIELVLDGVPASALATVLNFGFFNPDLSLGFVGAPGCTIYADQTISLPLPAPAAGRTSTMVPVPQDAALVGGVLFSQCASLAPLNSLGIVTSNGQILQIGF